MKNVNIFRQTTVLLSLGLYCTLGAVYGQDGPKKPKHTENRYVTKHGKDSTVTIMTEDFNNGRIERKTIVVKDGDTSTNVMITETSNGGSRKGTSVIIDMDTIVKIDKLPEMNANGKQEHNLVNIDKRTLVIVNGDTISTHMNGEDLNITIDTARLHERFKSSKSFKEAAKKGFTMTDKYIVINMDKFKHSTKDSTKKKEHNVVGEIGLEGFDLGFTQFIDKNNIGVSDANNLMDLEVGRSVNVNFRVMDLKVNLVRQMFYLNAGLEFDLHDYGFSNSTTLLNNDGKFGAVKDSVKFSRDKLSTQYLELPIMLCFNSNPKKQDHSFSLGVGAYGGILLGAYTKQVSDSRGLQRIYGNYSCNPIDYGVVGAIGYGDVQLFGKYNMSSIFQTAKGAPDLQTFTFGIKLFHPFSWS
jgi:hypothetical protein